MVGDASSIRYDADLLAARLGDVNCRKAKGGIDVCVVSWMAREVMADIWFVDERKGASMETLEQQLSEVRKDIQTDGYQMSIGELTNLYSDNDLIIDPTFQRLFRWDDEQKSRLIESILLGIPIPSIFVAQDTDGRWELVDGLQRLSTVLQLQGVLRGAEQEQLRLQGTKLLSELDGVVWSSDDPEAKQLSAAQRRDIKRAKLDVKIIKRGSSDDAKYDLFQRLNSFGSSLTAQEIRNATLAAISPTFVGWIREMAEYDPFVNTTRLPEKLVSEKYNEELVLRFLWLHRSVVSERSFSGFQEKLEDEAKGMARNFEAVREEYETVFRRTFDLLYDAVEGDVFRRWNAESRRFKGGFLNTAFEVLALGLGNLIFEGVEYRDDIREAVHELWGQPDMTARFATGKSTEQRLAIMIPKGRDLLTKK